MDSTKLTLLEGGKADRERKMRSLFDRPWELGFDEFERLCEEFELSRSDAFDLTLARIRHEAASSYEAAAVLAVFDDSGTASDILAKGRRKSFKIETSVPPSRPR